MTVPQLLERHERTLTELQARLDGMPEDLWTWRPAPGAWSPAEVYDHVDRIARLYSFARLEACLQGKGRAAGGRTFLGLLLLNLSPLAGRFRLRREFPAALVPEVITKAAAGRGLEGLRSLARAVAPQVAADPGRVRVEHVRLGWLTAAQWFAFAEIHSRHHLEGQLTRLQEAWSQGGRPRATHAP